MEIKLNCFVLLLSWFLIGCKDSKEKRFSFSNPLDSCSNNIETTFTQTTYDRLNKLSFKVDPQWKISFNDNQNVTGGIDTVASDKFGQIRTFTINTTPSKLGLRDFFIEEISFMEKDTSVSILSLGEYLIDSQPSLYVITQMTEQFPVKNVFFYVKRNDSIIIIIQLSINAHESTDRFCELMDIIHSISLKADSKILEASVYLQ